MPETCNLNDCPVSVRVDALKEEFNTFRASAFSTHREMFQRLGQLEKAEAAQEKHFETVNEKLDKLIEWQENQLDKPARRWEGIVEKAIWAGCAAVIAFLLGGGGV